MLHKETMKNDVAERDWLVIVECYWSVYELVTNKCSFKQFQIAYLMIVTINKWMLRSHLG